MNQKTILFLSKLIDGDYCSNCKDFTPYEEIGYSSGTSYCKRCGHDVYDSQTLDYVREQVKLILEEVSNGV